MHFQILDIDIGIILLTKLKTSCIVQQFLHTFIFDVLYSAVKWNCITWIDLSNNCCNRDTNLFHCQKEIFFCLSFVISSVQLLSHARLFATPWTIAHQTSLSITNSQSLPKLMSTESVMPSSYLILCYPFLLLPSIPPSIRIFSNESFLHIRWPKYWSVSFSISPFSEYSGLISFRLTGLISLQSKGLSRVFSNTTVQKHQVFAAQLPLQSNSHIHSWLLEKA